MVIYEKTRKFRVPTTLVTGKARGYALIELQKVYRYYLGKGSDDRTEDQEDRALNLMGEIEFLLDIKILDGRPFGKLMDFWGFDR